MNKRAARPAPGAPDHELTARVRRALMADDSLRLRSIHITVLHRWVSLLGLVLSQDERLRAVQVAQGVNGVREVIDRLGVR